jgi:hypothetical protein
LIQVENRREDITVDQFRIQLGTMLNMQVFIFGIACPPWADRGLPWQSAVKLKTDQLLDHLVSWNHGNYQSGALCLVRRDLVELWHYGLSRYIVRFALPVGSEELSTSIIRRVIVALQGTSAVDDLATVSDQDRRQQVEIFMAKASAGIFDTAAFVQLMVLCGLSFEELYRRSVGKSILQRFRLNHGAGRGTYVEKWAEQEDEDYVDRIVASPDVPAEELPAAVYRGLEQAYGEFAPALA